MAVFIVYLIFYTVVQCPGEGQFFSNDCRPLNATCSNPFLPVICDVPMCSCPIGQVLNEETNKCVNASKCSECICKLFIVLVCLHQIYFTSTTACTYMGAQYQDGEQIEPNCSTRCTCQQGQFQCQPQDCSESATCCANGDPHYRTFDYRYYSFQGDCEYVLTEPYDTSEFSVIVRNGKCSTRNPDVTCTERVTVLVPNDNIRIELGRRNGGTVTINGMLQHNSGDGIIMQSSRVTVQRSGGHPHVLFPTYGVRIFWNGGRHVKVTVSRMWEDRLCGLCGNFNDDKNDDFKMPNGSLAMTETAFSDSWQFNESSLVCNPTPPPA